MLYSLLAFQFGPFAALSEWSKDTVVFDVTTDYRAVDVPTILKAFGEEGRAVYVRFLLLDFLNPLLFGLATALIIAFGLGRAFGAEARVTYLAWVPIGPATLDILENVFLLIQLQRFPQTSFSLATLTHATTEVKLVMVNVVLLLMAASLITAAVLWAWRRTSRDSWPVDFV